MSAINRLAVLAALLVTACARPVLPPTVDPPVEKAWMTATFQQLAPRLNEFACLADKAYPDYAAGRSAECDRLIPDVALQAFHPAVPSRHDTADYVIRRDDAKHEQDIAIRGTDINKLQDIMIDASLQKPATHDALGVRMHSGFRDYALAVFDDLRQHNRLAAGYHTYLVGHSLGGAAALIVALELQFARQDPVFIDGVYTFGQPRVFDNAGAISWPVFAHRVFRIVSCRDPVPLVPRGDGPLDNVFDLRLAGPSAADYQHLGQEIVLFDRGNYWVSGEVEVWRDYHRELDSLIVNLVRGQPIDHAIRTYEERIGAASRPTAAGPSNPATSPPCTDLPSATARWGRREAG